MVTIKLNIISIKFFLNNNIERPLKGYIATGVVVGEKSNLHENKTICSVSRYNGWGKGYIYSKISMNISTIYCPIKEYK